MIKKTEHIKQVYIKTFDSKYNKKQHIEKHLVTSVYFLFILIYKHEKLISSND
jgi:hypothetical protein